MPASYSFPKKKRSGPYIWEYSSASKIKKRRSHKRRGLSSVPQTAMSIIGSKLGKNVTKLYMTSPKSIRNVLKPNMNLQKKIFNLRSKINPRTGRSSVNWRRVNPGYVRIVKRLQELNRTPNENYEMRGENSTGWYVGRVQSIMNLMRRLRQLVANANLYYNEVGNRNYQYSPKSKTLIAEPNNPRGVYVTIAKGVNRRPNGSLFFNLRKRKERKRRTVQ